MDLSNFPENHSLYSVEKKGVLSLLKSEIGYIPICEVIALAPKCYSVLLDNKVKSTVKGIDSSERLKIKHAYYKKSS